MTYNVPIVFTQFFFSINNAHDSRAEFKKNGWKPDIFGRDSEEEKNGFHWFCFFYNSGAIFAVSVLGRAKDIWSNIPVRLEEFPRAKSEGTLEAGGVYLTVYPELRPNTDSKSF